MSDSHQWHVKTNGRIRGPFSLDQMRSMKQRGRLDADTEVSHDRATWVFAVSIPELFGDIISVAPAGVSTGAGTVSQPPGNPSTTLAAASPVMLPSLPATRAINPQVELEMDCYYQVDGMQQGPVSMSGIRDLIQAGTLRPDDFVWLEGSPTWLQVQDVPAFGVADHLTRAKSQFHSSPMLVSSVAALCIMLIALPAWFIIASDRFRYQNEADRAARELAEKNEAKENARYNDGIAREKRQHDETIAIFNRDNVQHDEAVKLQKDSIKTQQEGFSEMAGAFGRYKKETSSQIASAQATANEGLEKTNSAGVKADWANANVEQTQSDLEDFKKSAKDVDIEVNGKKVGEGKLKLK